VRCDKLAGTAKVVACRGDATRDYKKIAVANMEKFG
jgi:hypothetical protein